MFKNNFSVLLFMKILILDRHKCSGLRDTYKRTLDGKGHNVVSAQMLHHIEDFMVNMDGYLSQFDIAVAHPHPICMQSLEAELNRRKNFRMIFYKVSSEPEYNGRVIFREYLNLNELVDLVENGW